jgi:oligopeptide transport system permease protein
MTSSAAGGGLWHEAVRRLRQNRAAMGCVAVLVGILVLALLGPLASPWAIDAIDWDYFPGPPTLAADHWFGTDASGRDLFVRVLFGVRVSLLVALLATAVSFLIGVLWGATAGYLGGRTDEVMMRFVDVLYALPYMFFVIVLTVLFGSNIFMIFIAIGAVGWLTMARIVRGQTLTLRHREFVEAAIVSGVPTHRIILRHIVPNVIGPVVVYATLTIPQIILFESFLSFLGLGVQEPLTSLGKLIAEGAVDMEISPWMLVIPAAFLAVLLLCFNFIGDGLRDALDPSDR